MVTDIAAEVRTILAYHLGIEATKLTDEAKLAEDLGADSLDLVEIVMSFEEQFGIDIPNHAATGLRTVGEAVRFIDARLANVQAQPTSQPDRWRLALR
ncbi:MAG: acyl carrier protein [Pseudomonadota bacterium]